MKRIFQTLLLPLRLGTLGATWREKLRLATFIARSRVIHDDKVTSFRVCVEGRVFPIWLRSNFADAFVLNEAFRSRDYADGLPKEPPKIIFDLGANLGFVSLYLRAKFPNASIHCFEPDPDNFALLEMNTRDLSGITLHKVAVGGRSEKRTFYRSPVFHMRNSLLPQKGGESFEVEVVALEEAMRRAGANRVDLFKFDIEGAEAEMFGAFGGFEHISHVVGEVHPHLWTEETYCALMDALNSHYVLSVHTEGGKVFVFGPHR